MAEEYKGVFSDIFSDYLRKQNWYLHHHQT